MLVSRYFICPRNGGHSNAVLRPHDQVDGEEPSAQRELAGAQLTVPLIAAFAAGKALRPACLEQRFLSLRLRPVQAQEFR